MERRWHLWMGLQSKRPSRKENWRKLIEKTSGSHLDWNGRGRRLFQRGESQLRAGGPRKCHTALTFLYLALFLFFCACVYLCMPTCYGMCMEIRGNFWVLILLLPPHDSWKSNSGCVRLGAKCHYLLSHLAVHELNFDTWQQDWGLTQAYEPKENSSISHKAPFGKGASWC